MKSLSCKIIYILGLWVFSCSFIKAQTKVDSLRALVDASNSDEDRFENTYKLLMVLKRQDKEAGLALAKENLEFAQNIGNATFEAKSYRIIGLIYRSLYRYEEAIESYQQAIKLASLNDLKKVQADALSNLSYVLTRVGNKREALNRSLESLALYEKIDNPKALTTSYHNIGTNYKELGVIDSAKIFSNKAINLATTHNIKLILLLARNAMGNITANEGNWLESMEHYQAALKVAEELEDSTQIGYVLGNIAIRHKDLGDFEQAELHYLKALDLSRNRDIFHIHHMYYNLAIMYIDWGDLKKDTTLYEKSLKYLRPLVSNLEQIQLKGPLLYSSSALAKAYFLVRNDDSSRYFMNYAERLESEVDDGRDKALSLKVLGYLHLRYGRSDIAETQLLESYKIYEAIEHIEGISNTAYPLYEVYKTIGKHDKSLFFLEKHLQLKDSMMNKEQIREIAKVEEGYKHEKEIVKKEGEIKLLEAKDQLTQLTLIVVIGGAVLIIFIGFIIARIRIKSKAQQTKNLQEVGQFKEVMTGMIAHDLKNPLSIIMGSQSENQGTRRMAGRMLHLVQNMLDVHKFESTEVQLQKQSVSLDDLIYEAIEQVRPLLSEKNIQIDKSIEEDIVVSADHEHLIRVFINFFTNAIKYAPKNSTIEVKGKVKEDRVDLSILDHGEGIAKEDQKGIFDAFKQIDARDSGQAASTGLGLAFCQLVLRAHGSEIEVDSEVGQWTEFKFSLPLSVESTEPSVSNSNIGVLTLSADERQKILAALPKLKSYGLHQAGEIELALKEFKTSSDGNTAKWVDEVLKAAYSNNQQHFDELIESIES